MRRKKTDAARFVVCINNEGDKASLEVGKLYRVIPDQEAAAPGYLGVVDESGEDYGYAATRFFPLAVPQALAEAMQVAGESYGQKRLTVRATAAQPRWGSAEAERPRVGRSRCAGALGFAQKRCVVRET